MKPKLLRLLTAIGLGAALAPAAAQADTIELGATKTPLAAPTCPPHLAASKCTIVLAQVTALETIRDGLAYPTTVTRSGKLVAFTLGLSRLDSNLTTATQDVRFLDAAYHGTTRAGIVVLKRIRARKYRRFEVVAQSEIIHLQPYLGQVVQFPLATPIPVTRGEVIGLTVPTWAPVLSFNLPAQRFAYRQSRSANCDSPAATNQAQTTIGTSTRYICDYPGTRVEYSVTEITAPAPSKQQIH